MGRYRGPAVKLSRREGINLTGTPKVQRYLENFRYYLAPPDLDGLVEFARRSDPEFRPGELRFWDL